MAKESTMKSDDLRAKSEDELQKELIDLRKAQLNMRFETANGQREDTSAFRKARRTIARIKTIMNEKKAATAQSGKGKE